MLQEELAKAATKTATSGAKYDTFDKPDCTSVPNYVAHWIQQPISKLKN